MRERHPNYVNQPLVSIFATFLTAFSFAIRVILLKPRADKLHIQSFHTTIVWPTLNIPDFLFSSDSLHHLGRNEQASLLVWIFDPLQVNPGAAYSENTKGLCREPKSHEVVHTLNVWSRTIVHCLYFLVLKGNWQECVSISIQSMCQVFIFLVSENGPSLVETEVKWPSGCFMEKYLAAVASESTSPTSATVGRHEWDGEARWHPEPWFQKHSIRSNMTSQLQST